MRMAKIQNKDNIKSGEHAEQQYSTTAERDTKWYSHLGRRWQFLTKLDILLLCNPENYAPQNK